MMNLTKTDRWYMMVVQSWGTRDAPSSEQDFNLFSTTMLVRGTTKQMVRWFKSADKLLSSTLTQIGILWDDYIPNPICSKIYQKNKKHISRVSCKNDHHVFQKNHFPQNKQTIWTLRPNSMESTGNFFSLSSNHSGRFVLGRRRGTCQRAWKLNHLKGVPSRSLT